MIDAALLDQLMVLITVIGIDLALSADNAVVIGLAAASLPENQRAKVITLGTIAAAVLRIGLAFFAVQLLAVVGLILIGGILLLYVAWKLWWDLKGHDQANADLKQTQANGEWGRAQFRQAIFSIVLADLSMSVENVLAVAGAARHHVSIMFIGLVLSVILTGVAASLIAKILDRHRWIGYVGVALIVWVSLQMIWDGAHDVQSHFGFFPG